MSYRQGRKGTKGKRKRSFAKTKAARVQNVRTGGFMGRELKFYDQVDTVQLDATSGNVVSWSPTGDVLNAPVQGSGPSDRDGRQITMKSVHFRGRIRYGTEGGIGHNPPVAFVRIICVMDKQCNKTALANLNDLLATNAGAVESFLSMRELENSQRFRVLYDKTHRLAVSNAAADTGIGPAHYDAKSLVKFDKDLAVPVNYVANAGASAADISDNAIYIFAMQGGETLASTGNTGDFCHLEGHWRLRYTG